MRLLNSVFPSRSTLCLLSAGLLFATSASAQTHLHANAQQLMSDANCMQCHNAKTFYHGQTKMQSLGDLKKQVRLCDANLKVGWFDEEVKDVSDYLNHRFYQFSLSK